MAELEQVEVVRPPEDETELKKVTASNDEGEIEKNPQPARQEETKKTEEDEEEKEKVPPASIGELYQFTSGFEKFLLVIAALASTGSGVSNPLMLVAFNSAFDSMGEPFSCLLQSPAKVFPPDTALFIGVSETVEGAKAMTSMMHDTIMAFVYIAIAIFLTRFIYTWSVEYVCQSQVLKFKQEYLKAVLRQDVAWYAHPTNVSQCPRRCGHAPRVRHDVLTPACLSDMHIPRVGNKHVSATSVIIMMNITTITTTTIHFRNVRFTSMHAPHARHACSTQGSPLSGTTVFF